MNWQTARCTVLPPFLLPDGTKTPPGRPPLGIWQAAELLARTMAPRPETVAHIARVRAAVLDSPEQKMLKCQLPGITWGGSGGLSGAFPLSGLLCFDADDTMQVVKKFRLDHAGNPYPKVTPEALKERVAELPEVCAAWLSPTTAGAKFLAFAPALAGLDGQAGAPGEGAYRRCYSDAMKQFSARLGVALDSMPSNPRSLCFASFDPDLFVADGAITSLTVPPAPVIVAATMASPPKLRLAETDIERRALLCVQKMRRSISGNQGSLACLAVARALTDGFALDESTAMRVMVEWNQTNADPPWPEPELLRRVKDAIKTSQCTAKGYLRDAPRRKAKAG